MADSSVFKEDIFEGKKVFITGGATGMGLGFAKSFLEHGAEVIIASRKEENLILASEEAEKDTGKKLIWKIMDVRDNEGTSTNIEEHLGTSTSMKEHLRTSTNIDETCCG